MPKLHSDQAPVNDRLDLYQSINLDELATVEEIAPYLRVKVKTVYAWVSARQIPFIKIGRVIRFDRDQITEWVQSKCFLPFGLDHKD